jgi:hypothetical protein
MFSSVLSRLVCQSFLALQSGTQSSAATHFQTDIRNRLVCTGPGAPGFGPFAPPICSACLIDGRTCTQPLAKASGFNLVFAYIDFGPTPALHRT